MFVGRRPNYQRVDFLFRVANKHICIRSADSRFYPAVHVAFWMLTPAYSMIYNTII
jgi:hypothetical protein